MFEPRRQTDYRGREIEAVFATDDAIWPLFFAVMKRGAVTAMRNMCLRLPGELRIYYFSVDCEPSDAFTDGFVYLVPRDTFVRESRFLPEWTSRSAVRPLCCLEVRPADFPLRERIFRHRRGESWLRFYVRLLSKPMRLSVRKGAG